MFVQKLKKKHSMQTSWSNGFDKIHDTVDIEYFFVILMIFINDICDRAHVFTRWQQRDQKVKNQMQLIGFHLAFLIYKLPELGLHNKWFIQIINLTFFHKFIALLWVITAKQVKGSDWNSAGKASHYVGFGYVAFACR